MGVRSDIVVCMKSEIYKKLSDESRHFLGRDARLAAPEPEGIAFIFEDIKWYRYSGDTEIEKLYSDLADLDGFSLDFKWFLKDCEGLGKNLNGVIT